MIRVRFDPDKLEGDALKWWQKWSERAERARVAAVAAAEKHKVPEFQDQIWSDLKAWLLEKAFHKKCAYCEARITGVSYGDAEHYRPKRTPTTRVGGKAEPVRRGNAQHPGYYWLAYDWRNLVPSCTRCNGGEGKGSQFPIAGTYVFGPDEVAPGSDIAALEKPDLLHPYFDDPEKHIRFGINGIVVAIDDDPRGQKTIDVCGLNREDLRELRYQRQTIARRHLDIAIILRSEKKTPLQESLQEITGAGAEFSAAAKACVKAELAALFDEGSTL